MTVLVNIGTCFPVLTMLFKVVNDDVTVVDDNDYGIVCLNYDNIPLTLIEMMMTATSIL